MEQKKQELANETPKAEIAPQKPNIKVAAKPKTIEELQQENEALKRQLERMPSDLEQRIEYFRKQELNLKRLANIGALQTQLEGLRTSATETADELGQSDYAIVILRKDYNSYERANFKVTDVEVVRSMIDYIGNLLGKRKSEIEQLIQA